MTTKKLIQTQRQFEMLHVLKHSKKLQIKKKTTIRGDKVIAVH